MKQLQEQERTPEAIAAAFDDAWARRDPDGLLALNAQDATVEGPLIPRLLRKSDGICRGAKSRS
jgi:hypothetical protein